MKIEKKINNVSVLFPKYGGETNHYFAPKHDHLILEHWNFKGN